MNTLEQKENLIGWLEGCAEFHQLLLDKIAAEQRHTFKASEIVEIMEGISARKKLIIQANDIINPL